MKKIYAMALCCAVCASASADGYRFKSADAHKSKKKPIRTEAATSVWRPTSQTDYMFDGEGWMQLGVVSFRYDSRGNTIEETVDEEGFLSKSTTEYNEFNLPVTVLETESEDGENWTNTGKLTYVYDPVIHSFFTERMGYDWTEEGQWAANYKCETNTITRDGKGNITELVKALPLGGGLVPAYKSVWSYGADGKANEYSYYVSMGDGQWTLNDNVSYKDIVWEKTDGQMTVYGDLLELTEGENLLKSAVVYYDGQPDGHYIVEYPDGGYFIKETTNDINQVGRTTRMEKLDSYGSLRFTVTEYFDEEGNILAEPTFISVQEVIMDEYGNMTLYIEKMTMGGIEELTGATRYTYTYDDNGNVTEAIAEEYDYDTGEYFPTERTVYGEYTHITTGIESVRNEAALWSVTGNEVKASAPGLTGLSVYNLQGVRLISEPSATVSLDRLGRGVYIISADGTGSTYRIYKR